MSVFRSVLAFLLFKFRFTKIISKGAIKMVKVRKRGKVYQYQFEIAPVDGTRKYINKSGFKTRAEAEKAGII